LSSDDDDTRTSYLAGEPDGSLPTSERAGLDELRALLASPVVWIQPRPRLEKDIVAAVVQAARTRGPLSPARGITRRRWLVAPARTFAVAGVAAAAALAAVVIGLGLRDGAAGPQRLAMVVSGTRLASGAHGTASLTRRFNHPRNVTLWAGVPVTQ